MRGSGIVEDNESTAANVTTMDGVVGTVVSILRWDSFRQSMEQHCTGVLVQRNKVLTSSTCLKDYPDDPATPVNFQILLPQIQVSWPDGSLVGFINVASIWTVDYTQANNSPPGFGVIELVGDVTAPFVEYLAPVFLGDVESALQSGRLDPNDAMVASVAKRSISDPTIVRRYARVDGTVELAPFWNPTDQVVLKYETRTGPILEQGSLSLADFGGLLFLKDKLSRRWVVAGIYGLEASADGISYINAFNFTGIYRNENHAADLLPLLGPDDDGDGNLDGSDNCPPSTCRALGLPATDCANPSQMDEDGNGVGDLCECSTKSLSLSGLYHPENSNELAESRLGVDAQPDLCEPVPLMKLPPVCRFPVKVGEPQFLTPPGPSNSVRFVSRSWIGSGLNRGPFLANDAFRYCACYDSLAAEWKDDSKCAKPLGGTPICDAGHAVYAEPHDEWKRVDVYQLDGMIGDSLSVNPSGPGVRVDGTAGTPKAFQESRLGLQEQFEWRWLEQARARQFTHNNLHVDGQDYYTTQGFLASAVLYDETVHRTTYSQRDALQAGKLRTVLKFYSLPLLQSLEYLPTLPTPPVSRCPFCRPVISPWDFRVEGFPLSNQAAFGTIVVNDKPSRWVLAQGPCDGGLDVTSFITTSFQRLSERGPWSYIRPVEPYAVLAHNDLTQRMAMVPLPGNPVGRIQVVETTAEGLSAGGAAARGSGEAGALAEAQAEAQAEPGREVLPAGGQATYSAWENTVYFVGGTVGGLPAGLSRFDLTSGKSSSLTFSDMPAARVLAATYDVQKSTLYALDVASGNVARLVSFDLLAGTSRVLWTGAFTGTLSVSLAVTEEGDLLLTAAAASSYESWRMRALPAGLVFIGKQSGDGKVVDAPIMQEHQLALPVVGTDGAFEMRLLEPSDYVEGAPCTTL